jgi:hypothetical protein
MKYRLPILSLFFLSCISFKDNNLVHIGNDKHIKLIKFSDEQISKFSESLETAAENDYSKGINPDFQVDLGMSDVPVLDQGSYGTCVTFSSTAALDAILAQGDFISQQCSLELDLALGDNYWDGAYYPSEIIAPLKQYGVIKQDVCDNTYPVTSVSLASAAYVKLADQDASKKIAQVNLNYTSKPSLAVAKAALDKGHRLLIGFNLQNNSLAVRGFNVIINGVTNQGGLWACQQSGSRNYCTSPQAGHEVLVIGYDDVQQLFKIRNSWGNSVGDDGDFYMSYAYFGKMVIDSTEVW